MGTGHEQVVELAHGLAAAAHKDGEALVAIGLDAIGVDMHHQGADLTAGSCADRHRERCEGHRLLAIAPPGGQGPHQRPGLSLAAGVVLGTVVVAGVALGGEWEWLETTGDNTLKSERWPPTRLAAAGCSRPARESAPQRCCYRVPTPIEVRLHGSWAWFVWLSWFSNLGNGCPHLAKNGVSGVNA